MSLYAKANKSIIVIANTFKERKTCVVPIVFCCLKLTLLTYLLLYVIHTLSFLKQNASRCKTCRSATRSYNWATCLLKIFLITVLVVPLLVILFASLANVEM